MANSPDERSPITDSQRLSDPAAAGAPTSPSEPEPPRSPQSSATADSARDDNARSQWLSVKILRPIILGLIGVGLLLGGMALYSSPSEPSPPSVATIQLKSTFSIAAIRYTVSQASPSITKITIYVQLPSNVIDTPTKAPAADLWLELPPGVSFEACPPDACRFDPNDKQNTWFQALDFKYENFDNKSGEALTTFFVKAPSFGYVFNDTNASAAIPRVDFFGPGSVTPILYTDYYNVTSADNFDWSTQPQLKNATEILWYEPVTSGAAPGIVAAGINHANETKDINYTFFAGALIGLAGAALLAAIQETLHVND
jgi:hypothetical protein